MNYNTIMPISTATTADIPELVQLINIAYRGETSKKGWATEADLVKGSSRTDKQTLLSQMNTPDAIVLKYCNEKGAITGCVYLHRQGNKLYLGLLTVEPGLQGGGIGKQLMTAAEDHAKKMGCHSVFMTVVDQRHGLIAWYERHGYHKTGETKPFPAHPVFGIPTQPLLLLVMEKRLTT